MNDIPEMEPIITQIIGQIRTEYEGGVLKAVQQYGIHVDEVRLLTALKDAKSFYEEGYRAAMDALHEHEVMTNADRIRAMTDEELAEFIIGGTELSDFFVDSVQRWLGITDFTEWLKQPHEESNP